MPLNPASMISDFTKLFMATASDPMTAANQMATAYDKYASQAIATGAVPCPLVAPGAKAAMVPILAAGMAPAPVPGKLSAAWVSAVMAYWAPASFVGPPLAPSPAPTVAPGAGVVFAGSAAVLAVLLLPLPSAAAAASMLATALHAMTSSGIATSNAGPLTLT